MNALILSLVLGADPSVAAPAVAPVDPVAVKARAALGPFKKSLKEALTTAMAKSPEAAVDVCSRDAPALAARHSSAEVTLGRSAFKLRNPKNAPADWVKGAMEALAKEKSGSEASKVVPLEGGRVGYAEAIWVGAPCLVCHGEAVAPGLDAKLKAAYPQDAARGFKLGDFRGVFWAELKTK
ncbi:MAG: DUF3365 domain-containing protein [Myxococcus sp.]|nr:DUF3365 domain-containing protein [Myxococcus sp.]